MTHKTCDFCGKRFSKTDDWENMSVTSVRYGSTSEGRRRKRDACAACGRKAEEFLREMTGRDDCGTPLKPEDRKWRYAESPQR